MTVPRTVIQDSDDEDLQEDLHSSGSQLRQAGTPSTEFTSRELGDVYETGVLTDSLKISAMSKLKRSRTTTDSVGKEKRRLQRTYGTKAALDDSGLRPSGLDGHWAFESSDKQVAVELQSQGAVSTSSFERCMAIDPGDESLSTMPITGLAGPTIVTTVPFTFPDAQDYGEHNSNQAEFSDQMATSSGVTRMIDEVQTYLDGTEVVNGEGGQNNAPEGVVPTLPKTGVPANALAIKDIKTLGGAIASARRWSEQGDEGTALVSGPKSTEQETLGRAPRNRAKRKPESGPLDELCSDDVSVTVPKEHYQPRPTRSRSSRTVDDSSIPIDLGNGLGSAGEGKSRLKRRKTTGGSVTLNVGEDELGAIQHRDQKHAVKPRFSEKPPNIEVVGTASATQETQKSCPVPYDPSLPGLDEIPAEILSAKKKRGRPKKNVVAEIERPSIEDLIIDKSFIDNIDPDSFDVRTSEKRVGMETNADETVKLDGLEAEEPPVNPVLENGRRALKKGSVKGMATADHQVFEENATGSNLEASLQGKEYRTAAATGFAKEATPPPERTTPPSETPKRLVEKGPDKHSPLNSGKVPYRVGLSRRARIEPLLKIVRK